MNNREKNRFATDQLIGVFARRLITRDGLHLISKHSTGTFQSTHTGAMRRGEKTGLVIFFDLTGEVDNLIMSFEEHAEYASRMKALGHNKDNHLAVSKSYIEKVDMNYEIFKRRFEKIFG